MERNISVGVMNDPKAILKATRHSQMSYKVKQVYPKGIDRRRGQYVTSYIIYRYFTRRAGKNARLFPGQEVSFHNHEIIFAYSNTMNKIGLILSGRAVLYYCDEEGNQYMIDELKKDCGVRRTLSASCRFPELLRAG